MSESEPWLMRVESGLSAHFKQPSGPSRSGTEWAIGLKRGDETHTVRVRAFLAEGVSKATRTDQGYQARTAMQYLNDLLARGWHPSERREHEIIIGDPLPVPGAAPAPRKRWWRFW
jgi:hypothetical protein